MATTKFFFLGFRVDSDLESRLANCSKSDKLFLEEPHYLERITLEADQYMGRRIDSEGIPVSGIEDSAKNVVSLMRRVAPGWNGSVSQAVLVALEEEISGVDMMIGY